jgi:hypothetical protein
VIAEAESLPQVFDLWEIAQPTADGDISFGIPGSYQAEVALWELDLPADPESAASELQRRGEFIKASFDALNDAPGEIEGFVKKAGGGPLSDVSFDVSPAQPFSDAEQDALRLLTYLDVGPDEVSFAVAEQSKSELEQASQQFQTAFDRMLRLASHFAWVETWVGGSLSGRTVVGWSGNMHNAWAGQIEAGSYGLHQKAVSQALDSRNIVVHACVVTIQSAAKLAVLLTNPAGAVLALPIAWKLVNQILKDVEKYREITNQEMNNAE